MPAAPRPNLRLALLLALLAALCWAWMGRAPPAPAETPPPPPAQATIVLPPVEPADLVMVGDSLTAGGDWSAWFPTAAPANHGVSGDTTEDVLRRIDRVLEARPRRVLLMVGINDVGRGVPRGRTLAAYRAVLEQLQAQGVEVVVQSTLECRRAVCGGRLAQVRQLNRTLERLAEEAGMVFLDLNTTMSDAVEGLRSDFTTDGVHLTPAGYLAWREALDPLMREYAGGADPGPG